MNCVEIRHVSEIKNMFCSHCLTPWFGFSIKFVYSHRPNLKAKANLLQKSLLSMSISLVRWFAFGFGSVNIPVNKNAWMRTVRCSGHTPCHAPPSPPSTLTLPRMPDTMHATCHACPLPCTPPAMHAPCHACPLPCMPPAMHAPCHACPLLCMLPCPHHANLPRGQNSWHMLVKTLPFHNYWCGR